MVFTRAEVQDFRIAVLEFTVEGRSCSVHMTPAQLDEIAAAIAQHREQREVE